MKPTPSNEKAAAELIGALVLVSLIVVVIGIIAVVWFSQPAPMKIPAVAASITNESKIISISHEGGDPVPWSDLSILVDGVKYDYSHATDYGDSWTIGEVITINYPIFPDKVDLVFNGSGFRQQLMTSRYFGTITPTPTPYAPPTSGTPAPVPAPVASFTSNVTSGIAPLAVRFTDTSANTPTSWLWNFGDGATSTVQNPVHTYTAVGTYPVTLTVQNSAGSSSATNTISVITPISGSITLNALKPGVLVSGGLIQFRVTGASWVTHGSSTYSLNSGDVVQLILTQDSVGTVYIPSTTINTFSFSNVRLVINGDDKGVNTINGIWISAYDQFSSTLSIDVPFQSAWTQFTVNGANVIYGDDRSRIQVFNTKPLSGSPMNLIVSATSAYYTGGATGYLITPYNYPTPTVTSINPTSQVRQFVLWPTIYGTDFRDGANVSLVKNGTTTTLYGSGVWVTPPSSLTCMIDITSASTGYYDVRVTNPDGKYGVLPNGFHVKNPTASAWSISPTTGARGWTTGTETITGMNFVSGATVLLINPALGPNITALNVIAVSSSSITCSFNLDGKPEGTWNVLVTNPDSDPGSSFSGFTITSLAPTITGSTPNTGAQGDTESITSLLGTNFQPNVTVVYYQGAYSIPLTNVIVMDASHITGYLVIPAAAPTGSYDVRVTNSDGKSVVKTGAFTVTPPVLSIISIAPSVSVRNTVVTITDLKGTTFVAGTPGTTVKLTRSESNDILGINVIVVSSTKITCTFTIPKKAALGDWNVQVTNPDSSTDILLSGFTIVSTAPLPVDADFSGSPTSGNKPVTVLFTDLSDGDVISWSWTFGDGYTSTDPNPTHTYLNGGLYSVSLTVGNGTGTNTLTRSNYINVAAPASTWIITASTSSPTAWGSISPSGNVIVANAASQSFAISPAVGYYIVNVFVDGLAKGAVTSYTFTNVLAGHTISAQFAATPTPTVSSIAPNVVKKNGARVFTVTGTNFNTAVPGTTVALYKPGTSTLYVLASPVNVGSSTSITGTFSLGSTRGVFDVRVTNPDGRYGTLSNGYTITN